MKFRTTMLSAIGGALAVAMMLAAAPIASAADMIGKCELTGEKGSIPLTPAKAGPPASTKCSVFRCIGAASSQM